MAGEYILVVDDEEGMRVFLEKLLADSGYKVGLAPNGVSALESVDVRLPDLILVDLKMPKMDGIEFLEKIGEIAKKIPVIIMTGFGTMENAIEAMKLGAYDFVNKPFEIEQILIVIDKALAKKRLEEENVLLRQELEKTFHFEDILSQNEQMHKIFDLIKKISNVKSHVLVQGETGTGKELVARAIHNVSDQKDKPFVPVDCGALTESLLESELFGHVKGAFTGAMSDKKGLLEVAEGGTAFLDEIGKISLDIQAKLLRVLQDGQIKRVGESTSKKINVRLIAASNEDLEVAVKEGRFREDLFYRLNVVLIDLPPLRERKEDVPLLVDHFIYKYNHLEQKNLEEMSQDALRLLMQYDWPGNVRELENLIHRCVVMQADPVILPKHLPNKMKHPQTAEERKGQKRPEKFPKAKKLALEAFEKRFLIDALKDNKGNVTRVAQAVGLDRRNLQRKFKQYKINPKDYLQ